MSEKSASGLPGKWIIEVTNPSHTYHSDILLAVEKGLKEKGVIYESIRVGYEEEPRTEPVFSREVSYDPTAPYWLVYRYTTTTTPHLFTTHSLETYDEVLRKVPAEVMNRSHNPCSCKSTVNCKVKAECKGVEHKYEDGFSRGMCEECSTVRCDLPEEV